MHVSDPRGPLPLPCNVSAPEGDGPILIDLPEGAHEIEVRRDGLPAYRRTVQIRAGRTLPLNVSLSR